MGKRNKIGKFYVERHADGTFQNWSSIRKALRQDKLKKAIKKVSSGYGHIGDIV